MQHPALISRAHLTRRRLLRAASLMPAILAAPSASAIAAASIDEMVIGNPAAPVTIIEYASMTCPHCAKFHQTVLPRIKAELVDTGKVRLIYRDFPLDGLAVRAAMLARCGGGQRFFAFADVIYAQQAQWARAADPLAALRQLGRLGGLSNQEIEGCLADRALEDAVLRSRMDGQQKFQIDSTPAFLINGKRFRGAPEFDAIRQAIEEAG